MANNYIVELFRWDDAKSGYEKKDDCTLSLSPHTGVLEISSSATPSTIYMSINIMKDDFAILSRERHNIAHMRYSTHSSQIDQTFDYVMRYKNNRFGVRFDTRSSSAESHFYDEYTKLRTKYRCTEKYPSGRIHFEGFRTDAGATGLGIEYFDCDGSPIKYMGEFEEGVYDGEGEFYSIDGNLRLHCKNICGGVPTGTGKFYVGKNKRIDTLQMKDFKDIRSTLDNYTTMIYARLDPAYEETLELVRFESLSLEDRSVYLFKELQKMKHCLKTSRTTQSTSFFNLF